MTALRIGAISLRNVSRAAEGLNVRIARSNRSLESPGGCRGIAQWYVDAVLRVLTLVVAVALAASSARAEPSAPLGPSDLLGARSLALSAYRGLVPGNDGIFFNAAGLAVQRRYVLEAHYLNDRASSESLEQLFGLSVVDSTNPLAAGLAWTRMFSGLYVGNVFALALAAPIGQQLFAGATLKYLSVDGPDNQQVRSANADASLFWVVSEMISIGVAGYNLAPATFRQFLPRGVGAGVAVGNDRLFHITADWRADFDRQDKTTFAFGFGGELLAIDMVALRAGYLNDDILGGQWLSGGVGIMSSAGVGLDLAYRQGLEDTSRYTLMAALKVYLPAQ